MLISAALVGWLAQRQLAPSHAGGSVPAPAASAAGLEPTAPGSSPSSPAAATRQVGSEVQRALEQSEQRLRQADR
jgi:hypothetical protein